MPSPGVSANASVRGGAQFSPLHPVNLVWQNLHRLGELMLEFMQGNYNRKPVVVQKMDWAPEKSQSYISDKRAEVGLLRPSAVSLEENRFIQVSKVNYGETLSHLPQNILQELPRDPGAGTLQQDMVGQSPCDEFETSRFLEAVFTRGAEAAGIVQFVSPKAFHHPGEGAQPTMTSILQSLADRAQPFTVLGKPWTVEIAAYDDHAIAEACSHAIVLRNPENSKETREIVLTTIGLGMSQQGRYFSADAISKSNQIVNVHKAICRTPAGQNPWLLSGLGIGRSASLSVYRRVVGLIDQGTVRTDTELMNVLASTVAQGKVTRGPKFVHTHEQFSELHAALKNHLDRQAGATPAAGPGAKVNHDDEVTDVDDDFDDATSFVSDDTVSRANENAKACVNFWQRCVRSHLPKTPGTDALTDIWQKVVKNPDDDTVNEELVHLLCALGDHETNNSGLPFEPGQAQLTLMLENFLSLFARFASSFAKEIADGRIEQTIDNTGNRGWLRAGWSAAVMALPKHEFVSRVEKDDLGANPACAIDSQKIGEIYDLYRADPEKGARDQPELEKYQRDLTLAFAKARNVGDDVIIGEIERLRGDRPESFAHKYTDEILISLGLPSCVVYSKNNSDPEYLTPIDPVVTDSGIDFNLARWPYIEVCDGNYTASWPIQSGS